MKNFNPLDIGWFLHGTSGGVAAGAIFSLGLWKAKRNVISVVIAGGLLGLAENCCSALEAYFPDSSITFAIKLKISVLSRKPRTLSLPGPSPSSQTSPAV